MTAKRANPVAVIKKIASEISKNSGIEITISPVSAEPTSYHPGEFPISRNGWEEQLFRLFDVYAPERDNSWRDYGEDFENETFWVHLDHHFFVCTCGKGNRGNIKHDKPCEYWWASQPNFFHKPSGYGVFWYKYPCREAYGNQTKTLEEFRKIIDECIESLK